MKDLQKISNIYFIGIGGIGMSALARYFLSGGVSVSGYDKTKSALTSELEKQGMKIHYEDNIELIDKEAELVVYTPAIPKDHQELNFYRNNKYELLKRSDVLQYITETSFNICVAGTHGKTTISTMIAHILRDSGYGCNAFLGGISSNYHTNFWSSKNNVCVVEADEFDRSFLKLKPDIAVITAMDADHLDIYGTEEEMQNAFIQFAGKIRINGWLVTRSGLKRESELKAENHIRYCLHDNTADAFASNITMSNGGYRFDVTTPTGTIENVVLNMGGMHNVENAVAAITIAHHLKIDAGRIRSAVENFRGIKRRFEYIIPPSNDEVVFIDDYAHHPEELKALLKGAKSLFRDRKCIIVFQPHLFTRTRDFAKEFAEVLDMADEAILLPIYPARELPVKGVTSELITVQMKNKNKRVRTKEQLIDDVRSKKSSDDLRNTVFITAGAGDIDALVNPIKEIIQNV